MSPPLIATVFLGVQATYRHPVRDTLKGLAAAVLNRVKPSKADLPLISMARFGKTRSAALSYRHEDNVIAVCGAVIDYDGMPQPDGSPMTLAGAAERLSGIHCLIHETPSSTPSAPRFRVILPAAVPRIGKPDELRFLYARWAARANYLLGGLAAPESFTLGQSFYWGSIEGKPAPAIRIIEGVAIDQCGHLGELYPNGSAKVTARPDATSPAPEDLEYGDDHPTLAAEAKRRIAAYLDQGVDEPQRRGNRAFRIVTWLADMRTLDGFILSPGGIADLIADACPETDEVAVVEMLKRRQDPLGCTLIGPAVIIETPPNNWISAAEAASRMQELFDELLHGVGAGQHLVNGTPGLGKTEAIIKQAVRLVADIARGPGRWDAPQLWPKFVIAAPTNALAAQIKRTVEHFADEEGLPDLLLGLYYGNSGPNPRFTVAVHLRGRGQDGMCKRSAEAKAVAKKGQPVYSTLCSSPRGQCPFFAECRHVLQKREAVTALFVITTHERLVQQWPYTQGHFHPRDATHIIIDESANGSLLPDPVKLDAADIEDLGQLGQDLTETRADLAGLRERGWQGSTVYRLALEQRDKEDRTKMLDPSNITPDEIEALPSRRALAPALFKLAAELGRERAGPSRSLWRQADGSWQTQGRVRLWGAEHQTWVFLDGTGQIDAGRAHFPDLKEHKLRARRHGFFWQIDHQTFSRHATLHDGNRSPRRRQGLARFVGKISSQRRTLVVASMPVEAKLKEEFGDMGATWTHFGAIRGLNCFKDFEAIIIIGRDELKIEDAERLAKARWYDGEKPIEIIRPDRAERVNLPTVGKAYQMRDGTLRMGEVRAHPDRAVQAEFAENRENEILQAIDRLRLVHPGGPKEIYILTSIPLDLELDRLTSWEELAGDERLNALLDRAASGEWPAVPLSAAWLGAHAADLFKSEGAVKEWLKALPLNQPANKGLISKRVEDLEAGPLLPAPAAETLLGLLDTPRGGSEPYLACYYRLAGAPGRPSRALVPVGADARCAIAAALGLSPESDLVT